MPRTAETANPPARSELRRKTKNAPRAVRIAEGSGPVRVPAQDHSAFAAACLPYSNELTGAALRLSRNPDDARDLVQETLMRAMMAWGRFEEGSNVRAWLHRILVNSFINGYRKRRRHQRCDRTRKSSGHDVSICGLRRSLLDKLCLRRSVASTKMSGPAPTSALFESLSFRVRITGSIPDSARPPGRRRAGKTPR